MVVISLQYLEENNKYRPSVIYQFKQAELEMIILYFQKELDIMQTTGIIQDKVKYERYQQYLEMFQKIKQQVYNNPVNILRKTSKNLSEKSKEFASSF